jgi:hypothetical protein
VAILTRPTRAPLTERAFKRVVQLDNRLSFMDQAGLHLLHATGRGQVIQVVWIYEHPVDLDGLRRFHRSFGYGLLGRRIERSPLPFGRHRWVSSLGPSSDIDFADRHRPRAELGDWLDERAQLTVDPECGPGWHLAVAPFTDGSTAISLVMSHYLTDGVGAMLTVADAVNGHTPDHGYARPLSRTRFRGVLSDLRDMAKGAPEAARAMVAAGKLGLRHSHQMLTSSTAKPILSAADGDSTVVPPAITIFVDMQEWDARANSLNGTSYSLLAGFVAKLAERLGRRRADGAVTLLIALDDRTGPDDTRANALLFAQVGLGPTPVTADLTGARIAIRRALKTSREVPDATLQLLPLVPLVPKQALKRAADLFFGTSTDLPVSCSNLGDIDPAVSRPAGTEAEYVFLRGVDQNVQRADMERAGGQLVVVAVRIGAKISIAIVAYQPGSENSKLHLRRVAAHTLTEFDLTGEIA